MKWKIVDSERDEFIKKQLFNPRKGGGPVRLGSSGPSSPAMNNPPSQATERLVGVLGQGDIFGKHEPGHARIKSPPRSATPPLTSYPMANESYTPDRGPRPHHSIGFKQSPTQGEQAILVTPAKRLFQDGNVGGPPPFHQSSEVLDTRINHEPSSPNVDPAKPSVVGLRDHSANSPPTLYSDTAVNNANGGPRGLVTPLVSRHAPRLAPPSTAQVPSQYMNFSSPAPFWKYVDLPSTPAKQPLDLSPIKLKREDDKDGDDEQDPAQPSSPPILEDRSQEPEEHDGDDNDDEKDEDMTPDSPSRTVSRPVSRAHLPGPGSQRSRSNSNVNGFGSVTANGGMVRGASLGSFDDAGEEGGFDLTKYFISEQSLNNLCFLTRLGAFKRLVNITATLHNCTAP